MLSASLPILVMVSLTVCQLGIGHAHADTLEHKLSAFASGSGSYLYLAAGVGLPLLGHERDGRTHTLRALDSLVTSVLLSEGLKRLTREKRPDSSERNSLPSGHATAAFAIAAIQSSFHPKQAPYWYLGAAAISASRVTLHRHYVHDVVAGAALGYGTARVEMGAPRGLILSPFIPSRGHGAGINLSSAF